MRVRYCVPVEDPRQEGQSVLRIGLTTQHEAQLLRQALESLRIAPVQGVETACPKTPDTNEEWEVGISGTLRSTSPSTWPQGRPEETSFPEPSSRHSSEKMSLSIPFKDKAGNRFVLREIAHSASYPRDMRITINAPFDQAQIWQKLMPTAPFHEAWLVKETGPYDDRQLIYQIAFQSTKATETGEKVLLDLKSRQALLDEGAQRIMVRVPDGWSHNQVYLDLMRQGPLISIRLVPQKGAVLNRCLGFAKYADPEGASTALRNLHPDYGVRPLEPRRTSLPENKLREPLATQRCPDCTLTLVPQDVSEHARLHQWEKRQNDRRSTREKAEPNKPTPSGYQQTSKSTPGVNCARAAATATSASPVRRTNGEGPWKTRLPEPEPFLASPTPDPIGLNPSWENDPLHESEQRVVIDIPPNRRYLDVYRDLSTIGPLLYLYREKKLEKDPYHRVAIAKYQDPRGGAHAVAMLDDTYQPRPIRPRGHLHKVNQATCARCKVVLYGHDLQHHYDTHGCLERHRQGKHAEEDDHTKPKNPPRASTSAASRPAAKDKEDWLLSLLPPPPRFNK